MRPAAAASSASPRWTSPMRCQAGAQSFHSVVEASTPSKSFMSMPLATKRGRQWLAASWTLFSPAMRSLLDLLVLGTPGVESAPLIMIGEGVRLRLAKFAVQLGPAVVRLPRPAGEDPFVLIRRRGDVPAARVPAEPAQPR